MELPTEEEFTRLQHAYYSKRCMPDEADLLRRFGGIGEYIEASSSSGNKWYEFSLAFKKQQSKDEILLNGVIALRDEREKTPEQIAVMLKAHLLDKKDYIPRRLTRYSCLLCARTCPYYSDLLRHENSHIKVRSCICPLCGDGFILQGHLRRHLLSIHALVDRSEAVDPNKKNTMKVNGRIMHVCTFKNCNQVCRSKSALDTHLTKHTKEKPFTCNVCQMLFISRSNLYRHTRKFHK